MTKDQHIDQLHDRLTGDLSDQICECLDEGEQMRLSLGERTGIVIAVLVHELAQMVVLSGMSEAQFLTWCHDHYQALREFDQGKQH